METKSKIIIGSFIGAFFIIALFLVVPSYMVSSADSLSKDYDSITQTVTIKDEGDKELVKLILNTAPNYEIHRGYNKFAEFDSVPMEYLKIILVSIELQDKNDGMKVINRQIDYKIKGTEKVNVNDYGDVLTGWEKNGTAIYERQVIGSHMEDKITWTDISKVDFTGMETITVGLFTDVQKGDVIEWIPTFSINDKEFLVSEWAVWSESMEVGLTAYYKMDEGSGNIVDAHGFQDDMTAYGSLTYGETGIIETAINASGIVANRFEDTGFSLVAPDDGTLNIWIKGTNDASFEFANLNDGGITGLGLGYSGGALWGRVTRAGYSAHNSWGGWSYDTDWHMLTVTGEAGTNVTLFWDGEQKNDVAWNDAEDLDGGNFRIFAGDGARDSTGFVIDEVGYWNRTLTQSEITDLYNGGSGLPYGLEATYDLFNMSGVVQFSNGTGVNLADVYTTWVSNNTVALNTTTNSTGGWNFEGHPNGTFIVTGYDPTNASIDGDVEAHVVHGT